MNSMIKLFVTLLSISTLAACDGVQQNSVSLDGSTDSGIVGGALITELSKTSSSTILIGKYDETTLEKRSLCTGTLIAENVILTAAHCLPDPGYKIVALFAGTKNFHDDTILQSSASEVIETRAHDTLDLAILKVATKYPAFKVHPLPARDFKIPVDAQIEMIGYGRTSAFAGDSGFLRHSFTSTSKIFHTNPKDSRIMIEQPQHGVCFGDSGGPFFVHSQDGTTTLVGVTSSGYNFDDAALECHGFANFVDIRENLDWITKTISELTK